MDPCLGRVEDILTPGFGEGVIGLQVGLELRES